MKLLFDFFPVLFFFIAYKFAGIYIATLIAIGICFLQMIFHWIRFQKLDGLQGFTFILLAILGGATIWMHDDIFIKWKPSIINWVLGVIFLFAEFFTKKPFIQQLMQSQIHLEKAVWRRLNFSWACFFIILGCLNLYVIYHFNTDAWVNFKLFGMLGLTLVFIVLQSIYLVRHIKH